MTNKYGEHAACKYCGQDIEFQGRKFGWVDRGGNRQCSPFIDRGEMVKPKTKHSPFTHVNPRHRAPKARRVMHPSEASGAALAAHARGVGRKAVKKKARGVMRLMRKTAKKKAPGRFALYVRKGKQKPHLHSLYVHLDDAKIIGRHLAFLGYNVQVVKP